MGGCLKSLLAGIIVEKILGRLFGGGGRKARPREE